MEEIASTTDIAYSIGKCAKYADTTREIVTTPSRWPNSTAKPNMVHLVVTIMEQSDCLDDLQDSQNLNWSKDDQQLVISAWNSLVPSVNSLLDSLSDWTSGWSHCQPEVRDKLKQLEVAVRRLGYFVKIMLPSSQSELTPDFGKLMSAFDAAVSGHR
ncbi:hypothetical protein PT974_02255 [Cladobotryum mycophilum]|uniref:Uncharacterized protein n=1 Tax=Cladobotryum mycophilum TaxID=491253 RepID=A0ABR0SXM1_9HYPO